MYTNNFKDFGKRELKIASILLIELARGNMPDEFVGDKTFIEFNTDTGDVYFTDEDCNEVELNSKSKLEMVYMTEGGIRGFYDQIIDTVDETWDYDSVVQHMWLANTDKDVQNIINSANRKFRDDLRSEVE